MTSNNNSDVGGIDTAKLDPNRPLASYIDPVAPSVPAIVNLRLSFLECAERMMDRFAVLELTHIERKLKSEVEALVTYANDPRRTSPITAKESQDASKAYCHYATELNVLLLNTQQFFDDTARLVQPYYRQALNTNMRLSLEDRGTESTTAFLFVESLRVAPPAAPQAPTPPQVKRNDR